MEIPETLAAQDTGRRPINQKKTKNKKLETDT